MFKHRSTQKELLDQEQIPDADLFQTLRELDTINHLLGGYAVTFAALKKYLVPGKDYILVDIGCGGGDTLKRIYDWKTSKGFKMTLLGIDLKTACVTYAEKNQGHRSIRFICDDYRNLYQYQPKIDIIHACLFCHHLTESQIVELIEFAMSNNSTLIINDLERNPVAYYAIKTITALFSKSYLVKNDAAVSVLRGFKKTEWLRMIKKAGATHFTVKNKWAFRHQIIIYGQPT